LEEGVPLGYNTQLMVIFNTFKTKPYFKSEKNKMFSRGIPTLVSVKLVHIHASNQRGKREGDVERGLLVGIGNQMQVAVNGDQARTLILVELWIQH